MGSDPESQRELTRRVQGVRMRLMPLLPNVGFAADPELAPRIPAARARLEAGDSLDSVASISGLTAEQVVTLVLQAGADDPEHRPALIRTAPRLPGFVRSISEPAIARLWPESTRANRLALMAGLYQVLDAWDASHKAAQEANDLGERASSAYWHAIAHRREPDPGNAIYWFRRVGPSPVADAMQQAVPIFSGIAPEVDVGCLLANGQWDHFAFVDFCTGARVGSPEAVLAEALQQLEMQTLFKVSLDAMTTS